jgi:hypothetical protein
MGIICLKITEEITDNMLLERRFIDEDLNPVLLVRCRAKCANGGSDRCTDCLTAFVVV